MGPFHSGLNQLKSKHLASSHSISEILRELFKGTANKINGMATKFKTNREYSSYWWHHRDRVNKWGGCRKGDYAQ